MYPRLYLANNLLKDDGVIFVSIDDHEVHNLRKIMDDIFGEENFVGEIIWHSKYTVANDTKYLSQQHEYILSYAKNKDAIEKLRLPRTEEMDARYTNPDNDERGSWKATPLHAKSGNGESYIYTFKNGVKWKAPQGRYPRFSTETLKKLDEDNRLWFGKDNKTTPSVKTYLNELADERVSGDLWSYIEVGHTHFSNEELAKLMGKGIFDNPKPTKLIKKMMQLSTNSQDIILDFFAGSGTTAHAILDLNKDNGNRKFICVQLPEKTDEKSEAFKAGYKTIAEIAKERIKRVIKKIKEENPKEANNMDLGFKVFKLAKSNYKIWEDYEGKDEKELLKQLELFQSPLIAGYKKIDLIYEILIKEGYDLNSKIEEVKKIKTNKVFRVGNGERFFYVCLDEKIKAQTIKDLKLDKETMFVCLDDSLDDNQKTNLSLRINLRSV
jgi:adenine-specific DNA-methyltransferase